MHQIFGKNLSSSKHVVCLFSVKPLHQNRPLHKTSLKKTGEILQLPEMAMIAAPTIIQVWLSRKKMEIRANFPAEKKLVTSLKSWESNVLYMTIYLVWTSWWNGKLLIVLYVFAALLSLRSSEACLEKTIVDAFRPSEPSRFNQQHHVFLMRLGKSLLLSKNSSALERMVFCLLNVFHFHLEPDL